MRPNNFDLIRLLAASQVLIYHGIYHLDPPGLDECWLFRWLIYFPGVPVFFVISGFLVSASFERSSSQWNYWSNRALRIFPALWVCFAVSFVSVLLIDKSLFGTASLRDLLVWLATQLTIFQYYNPDFLRPYGVGALNGSLWTIPVELQFYIALPIAYAALRIGKTKTNGRLLVALLTFFLLGQAFYRLPDPYYGKLWFKMIECSMLPHFWLFLLGVLGQRNFDSIKAFFEGKFVYWFGLHLVLIGIAQFLDLKSGYNKTFPLLNFTLSAAALSGAFTYRSLSDRILRGNDISYGVYIYHMVVINAFISLKMIGRLDYFIFASLLSIGLACISWRMVEKPCLMLKKKWPKKAES